MRKKKYISPDFEKQKVKFLTDALTPSAPGYIENEFPWDQYNDDPDANYDSYDLGARYW